MNNKLSLQEEINESIGKQLDEYAASYHDCLVKQDKERALGLRRNVLGAVANIIMRPTIKGRLS